LSDHDRVRAELVGLLDRFEPVVAGADHLELGLPVDQRPKRVDERSIVVREQDSDPLTVRIRHLTATVISVPWMRKPGGTAWR
jgi:hypothetical protein